MNPLAVIQERFREALVSLTDEDPEPLISMIVSAQDPKFGDYQANCAMPLGKKLSKAPREVAADLVARIDLSDSFAATSNGLLDF